MFSYRQKILQQCPTHYYVLTLQRSQKINLYQRRKKHLLEDRDKVNTCAFPICVVAAAVQVAFCFDCSCLTATSHTQHKCLWFLISKAKPQPKLVKRARAKDDSSITDQLVKEPSQPTSSHVVLPASHVKDVHILDFYRILILVIRSPPRLSILLQITATIVLQEEILAGISNTTDEKPVDRMSSIRGYKTPVSRGREILLLSDLYSL